MRHVELDNTFAAVRQLPLEVEFSAIENFVLQQHPFPVPENKLLQWLTHKNLLFMITASSIIAVTLLLTQPEQKSATITEPLPTLKEQAGQGWKEPSAAITEIGSEKEILSKDNDDFDKRPELKSASKSLTPLPLNTSALEVPELNEPAIEPIGEKALSDLEEKQNDSTCRVRTITSGFCTFGEDDKWIRAFLREMLKDNIITDTTNFRFTITGISLKVNGQTLEDKTVSKYNDLYESFMNERLNSKSCISLSVNGGCSLSKNIEN